MLCRQLSIVGALNVTHVFGVSRVIAFMLYCKPAHWHHQVQSVVHTFVLMLQLTLFFITTRHLLSSWVLMIVLHYDGTVELMFSSVQYANMTEQCKPC